MPKPTAEQMENRIALALTYRLAIEEGLVSTGGVLSSNDGIACAWGHALTSDDHYGSARLLDILGLQPGESIRLQHLSDSGRFTEALAMLEDLAGMTVPQVNRAH